MTPAQTAQMAQCIEHCAEIALYTRFMAVALMEADQADQADLTALFLELAGGPSFPGIKATPEAAQALLEKVRAKCKPSWKKSKKANPTRRTEFCPARAVKDLEISPTWFRRIFDAFLEKGECSDVASRFLHLRKSIFVEQQEPVRPEHLAEFIEAFEARILELARQTRTEQGGQVVDLAQARLRRREGYQAAGSAGEGHGL